VQEKEKAIVHSGEKEVVPTALTGGSGMALPPEGKNPLFGSRTQSR